MASITSELLLSCSPTAPAKGQSATSFLALVTQLQLQRRGLGSLDGVEVCPNVRGLFLQQNPQMTSLAPLSALRSTLEVVAADECALDDLQGLAGAPRLHSLSVSHNRLGALAGLAGCTELKELSFAHQQRPHSKAEPLWLEPASLASFVDTLTVLDLKGNGLVDISPLGVLGRLRKLDLSDNAIADGATVLACVAACWRKLEWLDTRGNACTLTSRGGGPGCVYTYSSEYRDGVVAASASSPVRLAWLDGRELTPLQTAFISRLEARRQGRLVMAHTLAAVVGAARHDESSSGRQQRHEQQQQLGVGAFSWPMTGVPGSPTAAGGLGLRTPSNTTRPGGGHYGHHVLHEHSSTTSSHAHPRHGYSGEPATTVGGNNNGGGGPSGRLEDQLPTTGGADPMLGGKLRRGQRQQQQHHQATAGSPYTRGERGSAQDEAASDRGASGHRVDVGQREDAQRPIRTPDDFIPSRQVIRPNYRAREIRGSGCRHCSSTRTVKL